MFCQNYTNYGKNKKYNTISSKEFSLEGVAEDSSQTLIFSRDEGFDTFESVIKAVLTIKDGIWILAIKMICQEK